MKVEVNQQCKFGDVVLVRNHSKPTIHDDVDDKLHAHPYFQTLVKAGKIKVLVGPIATGGSEKKTEPDDEAKTLALKAELTALLEKPKLTKKDEKRLEELQDLLGE